MLVMMMGCSEDAVNCYIRRSGIDTNPRVVRMLLPDGTPDDHWYYRSDQVVATSEVALVDERLGNCIFGPFEGPLAQIPLPQREHFLEDRCKTAKDMSGIALRAIDRGCSTQLSYVLSFFL